VGAKAFSAGFDLSIMGSPDADPEEKAKLLQDGIDLCLRLFLFQRPVVIAASGHALALGGILLCCADLRIGSDSPKAKVGLPEVAIGMQLPIFGVKLVEARMNSPTFYNRAVLLGDSFSTAEAVEAGFLDQIVPADEVAATATAEAARLGAHCKGGFGALYKCSHRFQHNFTNLGTFSAVLELIFCRRAGPTKLFQRQVGFPLFFCDFQ
jgi:enoyl-CoA hydratase